MPSARDAGHKERLLEAAIECLERQGYARTTARDLVAASGTNLGSIGYHFGTKEHLLNVALIEAFQRWLRPLIELAAAPGPATPLERLVLTLRGMTADFEGKQPLINACLEAWAQLARSEDLRAEMVAGYEGFRAAVAATTLDAFAAIGAPEVDADALAVLIIALFDGLLVRWQLGPDDSPDPARLVEAAQGAVLALAAAPSGLGR
jgi:AcrR family transcriptional regulator